MRGLIRGVALPTTMHNIIALRLLFVMANALGPFAALFFNRHYQLDGPAVALVITLASAFYLTGNLLGGALASRYAFRPLLLGTSSCSSIFLVLAMVFTTPHLSIIMVLLFILCAGVITPTFSMLTSLATTDANRIASFGYLHLASNLGSALLFVIGGYLLGLHSQYLMVFAASLSVACLLASALLALPERLVHGPQARQGILRDMIDMPKIVVVAGALFFALSILDAQREYQLPLWLDLRAVDSSASTFATIGLVNALLVILITQPLIALTSRFSTLTNLAMASIFYGIGFGAYAFFEHAALILSFVFFWTMGEILGITHITALSWSLYGLFGLALGSACLFAVVRGVSTSQVSSSRSS
ncbi:MFS transporter [Pseudomonas agarici]|uniref:MFS transporter n=1 Tax=Pseudomonas agarici TaxID=46677 RepID=UPI0015A14C43|nr:MFS transporter [Pseudomonas agarici]NWB93591.1 MFS transporter [Pseudomonas agarici]